MYRVQLAENSVSQKPKIKKFGVINGNYKELLNLASNKFKLNHGKIRLFVSRNSLAALPGTEITQDTNIDEILNDDVVIVVSNNQPYKGKNAVKNFEKDHMKLADKLAKPPRWPYPGMFSIKTPMISTDIQTDDTYVQLNNIDNANFSELTKDKTCKEMNGIFPILDGNVLGSIKKAISTNPKIKLFESNEGYISVDYEDDVVFPPITEWNNAVQRECRGLIISSYTGKILARRFHKFFNINQNSESLFENIDFNNAVIYEKLDGSLVSPILLDNNKIIWATRRQRIFAVEEFIEQSEINYGEFSRKYLEKGITPLFEYCKDSKPVSVLCYEKPMLVLLALRHNISGEYLPIHSIDKILFNKIPCVSEHKFDDIRIFKENTEKWTNREGVVISIPSGHKYKLKCFWYVYMCSALKSGGKNYFLPEFLKLRPTLKNIPTEKIWITALENVDDVISMCISLLPSDEGTEFIKFINCVRKNTEYLENDLRHWALESFSHISIKEPIYALAESGGWDKKIIENLFHSKDITGDLRTFLINLGKSKDIFKLEEILDVKWNNVSAEMDISDTILDLVTFDKAPKKLIDHVLNVYIPKKFSNILGIKSLCNNSSIIFPRNYTGNEGKIKGFWEMFTENDIYDLRIDVQPSIKSEYTSHNGNLDYVLILVQYGLFNNDSKKPHGSFAGVLIPTEYDVPIRSIINAFEKSFEVSRVIKMKHHNQIISKYKVFCDLDGVLVDFEQGVFDVTGRGTQDQTVSKMWNRILTFPKFFEQLNWTNYGQELWNNMLNVTGENPTILTGLPYSCKKKVYTEKRAWCSAHLGENIEVITTQSIDKYKYASYGHILIDDRYSNGKLWTTYGGTFIYHTSPERTLYELKRLYGKLNKIQLNTNISSNLSEYNLTQQIDIVTDYWPNITDKVVGIDVEWNPKSVNGISIIQIATPTNVWIIDMIMGSDLIKECVENLLKDASVLKIGFGMDMSDMNRLQMNIINLIDIQEAIIDCVNFQSKGNALSLSTAAANIIKKNINKTTEFQMSNWDKRPLSPGQINYASIDAAVLLDIYDTLFGQIDIPPKSNICSKLLKNKSAYTDDFDPTQSVEIIFAGIYLSPQSKQELLNKIPYKHPVKHATHITILYKPTEYETRGLPVGDTVELEVIGEYSNDKVQAVKCVYLGKNFHITISTNHLVPPAESNNIKNEDWNLFDNTFKLFGAVGVTISELEDGLVLLPERIRNKILDFQEYSEPSQSLKFKPGELSTIERAHIHNYTIKNNIDSKSYGKDNKRRLVLTMRRKKKADDDEFITKTDKIRKVTDSYQFSMLNIISNNSILPTVGSLKKNSIEWIQDIITPAETIYILRGLPGSGKSELSKLIANNSQIPTVCCSADLYFETRKLAFDTKLLSDAHAFCFTQAKNAIESNTTHIIIDNTNSQCHEFRKYIELGNTNGYDVVVLEIFCQNKDIARSFASRNSHSVPISSVLKMLSRWETYDSSLLITPYEFNLNDPYDINDDNDNNNSDSDSDNECLYENKSNSNKLINLNKYTLSKWIQDNKVGHYNKKRNRTHLCMGINTMQPMFLDISLNLAKSFLETFESGGITGDVNDEPKFITEITQEIFRMFFDIDYTGELSTEQILWIVFIIQKYVTGMVYVTGCSDMDSTGKIKTGLHLKCPACHVDHIKAKEIRKQVIEDLAFDDPNKNWDAIIDSSIYGGNTGIRMFGSRKATKYVDKGRVYRLYFAVSEDGEYYEPQLSNIELLKALSIHTFY